MSITTEQTPAGWIAYDDNFDGEPTDIGRGPTEADAIADLMRYGVDDLDRKFYIARGYLRYRLTNSARCKAAQIESMARLQRRVAA